MIDAFENWIAANGDNFKEKGLQYEVTKSPLDIDKPSVRIDFDSDKYVSRIVVWSTGECNIEALDVESERSVIDKYFVIESAEEFDNCFAELFEKIEA